MAQAICDFAGDGQANTEGDAVSRGRGRGTPYVRSQLPRGRTPVGPFVAPGLDARQDGAASEEDDGEDAPDDNPLSAEDHQINFSAPPVVKKLAARLTARRGGRNAPSPSPFEHSRQWIHEASLPLDRPHLCVDDFYQHRLVLWDPVTVYRHLFPGPALPCPRSAPSPADTAFFAVLCHSPYV